MVADGFGVGNGARFEFGVVGFVGVDVDVAGVRGQRLEHDGVVEFADAAAGVVNEGFVAVEAFGAFDKGGHVLHRRLFGGAEEMLPLDEGSGVVTVAPQFADVGGEDVQPFDADFALHAHGVVAQEGGEGRLAAGEFGQPVADGFVQVAGGDAVVAGVVKPASGSKHGRQGGFADA